MTYLSPMKHLAAVSAGHPRPLWYSRSRETWELLEPSVPESVDRLMNIPLGVLPGTGYRQFAVPLAEGDLLVAYTDWLMEACDERDEPLGQDGLLALASQCDPSDPAEFGQELLAAVEAYGGGRPAADDVTLMVMHQCG